MGDINGQLYEVSGELPERKNGMWEITLAPYSILTATTLDDYTDGTETGTTPEELSIPTGVNTENKWGTGYGPYRESRQM